jgi:hypothetical protein
MGGGGDCMGPRRERVGAAMTGSGSLGGWSVCTQSGDRGGERGRDSARIRRM